jgi:hypothetical protein
MNSTTVFAIVVALMSILAFVSWNDIGKVNVLVKSCWIVLAIWATIVGMRSVGLIIQL